MQTVSVAFNAKFFLLADSSAIVDSNLKLILGLVWTLILHYSIAKQDWDGHSSGEAENPEMSPKVKLMSWLKGKLPTGLPFSNFTSDWNDGILLGALVCTLGAFVFRHLF